MLPCLTPTEVFLDASTGTSKTFVQNSVRKLYVTNMFLPMFVENLVPKLLATTKAIFFLKRHTKQTSQRLFFEREKKSHFLKILANIKLQKVQCTKETAKVTLYN